MFVEKAESAHHKVVEFRDWMIRFGDAFDELNEIGAQHYASIIGADALMRVDEVHIAQDVEFAFSAADKLDFTIKKKVEESRKPAFRGPGALCHGLDQAMGGGKP